MPETPPTPSSSSMSNPMSPGEQRNLFFEQDTEVDVNEQPYNPLPLYFVPRKNLLPEFSAGKVAFSECPGIREKRSTLVDEDIAFLERNGVKKIISLTKEKELEKMGMVRLEWVIEETSIKQEKFPVSKKRQPPVSDVIDLVHQIRRDLANGDFVLIHCRGGRGRSAMLCAAVLITMGVSAKHAVNILQNQRGKSILNLFQRRFLDRFRKDWELQFEHRNKAVE
eukprot:gb/GECH01011500.1/.p1 GENE.gb/GECH01011500.1/~~gb/GECH01011500.1/.p1  ORF type:complete len:224 (+),score=38.34 gb/GECH01011500.1/:1-672(+)